MPSGPGAQTDAKPKANAAPAPANGMGGMMGGMEKMMEGMGGNAPKDLIPSLMDVPKMTPRQRADLERAAHARMQSSLAALSAASVRLTEATARQDNEAMQSASAQMREALAQYQSGLAAQRALSQGNAPRSAALEWFRRDMNLLPPPENETGALGVPSRWFHYIVIGILSSFVAAMVGLYFHKMRRAESLLTRLSSGTASAAPSTVNPSPRWSGVLRVVRIFQETPEVKTFRLMNPNGEPLPFSYLPGQFLTLTVMLDGKPVKRSYTIASSPTERDYVELTVKEEVAHHQVSFFLHEKVKEGDDLNVVGPSGKFTFIGQEAQSIVLIAGGVGITPMMSVLCYLTARGWPGDIFLLYCCRSPQDIIFRDELEYLQRRHPNLKVFITLSRAEGTDWKGLTGRLSKDLIAQWVPDVPTRRFHICGPVPFMKSIEEMLAELGVPKEQVKTESFGAAQSTAPDAVGDAPLASDAIAHFSKSEKSAPLPPNKTVLEAAEDIGVTIDSSCRVGTCGTCRVKLLQGAVTMEVEDGLEPGDKAANIILACQAKSLQDLTVEA